MRLISLFILCSVLVACTEPEPAVAPPGITADVYDPNAPIEPSGQSTATDETDA